MPMTCIVCRHPERDAIETALIAGDPLRDIERRFGVSDDALDRHRKVDIPELMAQSKQALAEVRGDTLYDRLRMLNSEAQQLLQEAKQSNNPDLALRAINRIERQLELEAKLLGQIDESAKIAIGINNAPQQQQAPSDEGPLRRELYPKHFEFFKAGATHRERLFRSRCSPLDFEMAYQARVAIDRIRFAINQVEQFVNHSPQAREAAFQLLDALDRLESAERSFQGRSKKSLWDGTTMHSDEVMESA